MVPNESKALASADDYVAIPDGNDSPASAAATASDGKAQQNRPVRAARSQTKRRSGDDQTPRAAQAQAQAREQRARMLEQMIAQDMGELMAAEQRRQRRSASLFSRDLEDELDKLDRLLASIESIGPMLDHTTLIEPERDALVFFRSNRVQWYS